MSDQFDAAVNAATVKREKMAGNSTARLAVVD